MSFRDTRQKSLNPSVTRTYSERSGYDTKWTWNEWNETMKLFWICSFWGYIEQFEWLTEFLGQNLKIRFFSEMQYSQKDKKVKRCSSVYDAKVHISNLHFSQRFRNFNFGWFVALLAWHNFLKKIEPNRFSAFMAV